MPLSEKAKEHVDTKTVNYIRGGKKEGANFLTRPGTWKIGGGSGRITCGQSGLLEGGQAGGHRRRVEGAISLRAEAARGVKDGRKKVIKKNWDSFETER